MVRVVTITVQLFSLAALELKKCLSFCTHDKGRHRFYVIINIGQTILGIKVYPMGTGGENGEIFSRQKFPAIQYLWSLHV